MKKQTSVWSEEEGEKLFSNVNLTDTVTSSNQDSSDLVDLQKLKNETR